MSLSVPVNAWTISIVFTVVLWLAARLLVSRVSTGGDYDFSGAVIAMLAMVATVAWWLAVFVSQVLL